VALKKKVVAKTKNKRLRKDDEAAEKPASQKVKPVKAAKKSAAKGAASKSNTKDDAVKQSKIRVPDAVAQSDAIGTMGQELDPFEVAKQSMKGAVPAIVEAMVEMAKQGSCSHAKTLLEMTGAKHMFDGDSETQNSGEPWAKLVLERLGEAESAAEQETASLQEESLELVTES
jgi:hypothetical protein